MEIRCTRWIYKMLWEILLIGMCSNKEDTQPSKKKKRKKKDRHLEWCVCGRTNAMTLYTGDYYLSPPFEKGSRMSTSTEDSFPRIW